MKKKNKQKKNWLPSSVKMADKTADKTGQTSTGGTAAIDATSQKQTSTPSAPPPATTSQQQTTTTAPPNTMEKQIKDLREENSKMKQDVKQEDALKVMMDQANQMGLTLEQMLNFTRDKVKETKNDVQKTKESILDWITEISKDVTPNSKSSNDLLDFCNVIKNIDQNPLFADMFLNGLNLIHTTASQKETTRLSEKEKQFQEERAKREEAEKKRKEMEDQLNAERAKKRSKYEFEESTTIKTTASANEIPKQQEKQQESTNQDAINDFAKQWQDISLNPMAAQYGLTPIVPRQLPEGIKKSQDILCGLIQSSIPRTAHRMNYSNIVGYSFGDPRLLTDRESISDYLRGRVQPGPGKILISKP